jgi:hypothetical protein
VFNLDILPYQNLITGALIIIVGFVFHFIGQLISVINWDYAVKIGIAEKDILPAYKDYENGMALADVAIGWIYGPIGIGMIMGISWSYQLAWIPGIIFLYHSLSFWFWSRNQIKAGHVYRSWKGRLGWFLLNFITGILAISTAIKIV